MLNRSRQGHKQSPVKQVKANVHHVNHSIPTAELIPIPPLRSPLPFLAVVALPKSPPFLPSRLPSTAPQPSSALPATSCSCPSTDSILPTQSTKTSTIARHSFFTKATPLPCPKPAFIRLAPLSHRQSPSSQGKFALVHRSLLPEYKNLSSIAPFQPSFLFSSSLKEGRPLPVLPPSSRIGG